jgi:hypothetical protein
MRGVQPEPIREHLVEVLDTVYPPKQVLAAVTGWGRTSFTTIEASGYSHGSASSVGELTRSTRGNEHSRLTRNSPKRLGRPTSLNPQETRLARLEAQLAIAQEATASLAGRGQRLEPGVR